MAPPPRAPPELIEDAVAEILLRIPPDEPAHLVRSSLVCKPWLRIVSDPAFLRRYRAFHRRAPLLGFLYTTGRQISSPPFIPTTTTAAPPLRMPAYVDHRMLVRDCRHGRVVLWKSHGEFAVWDPVTGHHEELPKLDIRYNSYYGYNVAVLCAVAGCDHRECHGGPFLVVFMANDDTDMAIVHACVYSSEARAWGTPDSVHLDGEYMLRAPVIGDAIYCLIDTSCRILKYDWVKRCFSVINLPVLYGDRPHRPHLMQNEDGSLGFASVSNCKLYLSFRIVDSEGVARWAQQRVIKHVIFLSAISLSFAEGAGVFLVNTSAGVFTFELNSERVKKVGESMDYRFFFFPFISFFTPDYARGKLPLLEQTN